MSKLAIIVPCRLESTRFPRKLLHNIKGRPLVLWVAERIRNVTPEIPLWFAVDDDLLGAPLRAAGFRNVRNMKGGILAWSDKVDPTVPKY